jgi:hypothetical protein
VIYRYGPKWGNTRYGYRYSESLLARLTPARRKILQPIEPRMPAASHRSEHPPGHHRSSRQSAELPRT